MSCPITEWYSDSDCNIHWPDTFVGSKLDYAINWNTYLTNENDTFVAMVWGTLPSGLSSDYNSDSGGISIISLEALAAGTHQIDGVMTHEEAGHEQKLPVRMFLTVT